MPSSDKANFPNPSQPYFGQGVRSMPQPPDPFEKAERSPLGTTISIQPSEPTTSEPTPAAPKETAIPVSPVSQSKDGLNDLTTKVLNEDVAKPSTATAPTSVVYEEPTPAPVTKAETIPPLPPPPDLPYKDFPLDSFPKKRQLSPWLLVIPAILILLVVVIYGIFYFLGRAKIQPEPDAGPTLVLNDESSPSTNMEVPVSKINPKPKTIPERAFGQVPTPNFSKQTIKGLKLGSTIINISNLPDVLGITTKAEPRKLLNFNLEKEALAAPPEASDSGVQKMFVYAVKRNALSATDAATLAKTFAGFGTNIKTNILSEDPINYHVSDGAYTYPKNSDLLEIGFVNDSKGTYGGKPYQRSSLGIHYSTGYVTDQSGATASALAFLNTQKLTPAGELKVEVLGKNDISMIHRYLGGFSKILYVRRYVDNFPIIDGGFGLRPEESRLALALNEENKIIGLSYDEFTTQVDLENKSRYPIISQTQAFEKLMEGDSVSGLVRANSNFPKAMQFDYEVDWSKNKLKTLDINDVYLAYYRNENQTESPQGDYYLPIYVFVGQGTATGPDFTNVASVEMRFFVPAVSN
jgi:hypothetical protein